MKGLPTLGLALSISTARRRAEARSFDLFLPAVNALADGSIRNWHVSMAPSFELCRRLDAEYREAAWDGCLSVVGPEGWLEGFTRSMAGRDPEEVAFDYAVLENAISLNRTATDIADAIRTAKFVAPGRPATHPLSNEVGPSSEIPFGFSLSLAKWRGIDPRVFVDFAVGMGTTDPEVFLQTVIDCPTTWFRDIPRLESALLELAANRDIKRFCDIVAEWNAEQDVSLGFSNRKVIVPAVWASVHDIIRWGDEFVDTTSRLVDLLLREKWAWWKSVS
jgi:hypothetical protein